MGYTPSETEIQNWVLLFLYNEGRSVDDMVEDGCKIMVFRRTLSDLEETLIDLENREQITENGGIYEITLPGKFHIKSTALIPYLGLNRNNLDIVLEKMRDECDERFLTTLLDFHNNDNDNDKGKQTTLVNLGSQHAQNFFQGLRIISELFPQT